MRLVRYSYPTYRSLATVPGGFTRSPWSGLFESAFGDITTTPSSRFPMDLSENKENIYVRAELPGVNRDDINVEVVDSDLTITAARKTPATEGQAEQSFPLSRSVSLSDEVQVDKISAVYENGLLTVTLPKREEAKPRKITVAVK
jgi:HSP20 family protein